MSKVLVFEDRSGDMTVRDVSTKELMKRVSFSILKRLAYNYDFDYDDNDKYGIGPVGRAVYKVVDNKDLKNAPAVLRKVKAMHDRGELDAFCQLNILNVKKPFIQKPKKVAK